MASTDKKENSNTVIVGQDYSMMLSGQTNAVIVKMVISMLLPSKMECKLSNLPRIALVLLGVIGFKMALEESKDWFGKLKFSDIKALVFVYQRYKYNHTTYTFLLTNNKYSFGDVLLSKERLSRMLSLRGVSLSQSGTYYLTYRTYYIKVVVDNGGVSFVFPDIECVNDYMNKNIIEEHKEIISESGTVMYRAVNMNQAGMLKLEATRPYLAFETDIYRELELAIKRHFLIADLYGSNVLPLGLRFNGEPGTGKTTFTSYIYHRGLAKIIIKYDMIQSSKRSFNDNITNIINLIEKEQVGPKDIIMVVFDEMDKWLESYIEYRIQSLRDKSKCKKGAGETNYEAYTAEEEDDIRLRIKEECWDTLFRMFNGELFKDNRRYVFIFNTNHFDNLWIGATDRYDALKKRFGAFDFKACGKAEVVDFLRKMNNKLLEAVKSMDTQRAIYEKLVNELVATDEHFNKIKSDVSIDYRSLMHLMVECGHDLKRVASRLSL